jgi:hypothetical protein
MEKSQIQYGAPVEWQTVNNESQDIYKTDEAGPSYNCLPHRMLTMKGQACYSERNFSDRTTVLMHATSDCSETLVPNLLGKSLKPNCFKNITKFL